MALSQKNPVITFSTAKVQKPTKSSKSSTQNSPSGRSASAASPQSNPPEMDLNNVCTDEPRCPKNLSMFRSGFCLVCSRTTSVNKTPAMYMIRSSSNMAQKSGFKVSSSELTKVRRAPTKRTIHKVFTMRSSRDTRSSRKTRMLELTPVSLLEPRASKMMLTHEKLTTTTSNTFQDQPGAKKYARGPRAKRRKKSSTAKRTA
mmetsp:Transcript_60632/g.132804  ORF Transcript_60632/g.132804 Transcript_60632/m.132804 type:complete len:202 (-) Transcript_60632:437-1042(-)